ncbi:MAG: PhoH family protein [Planctomycetaceae bacterium]|nr:PhoH family protein [Planctomycetaceae bacterium]MDO4424286.1 PhoH family protein [Planctomycetia bacterium]
MIEKTLTLPEGFPLTALFGMRDRYQRRVSDTLGVRIWSRGNEVYFHGQEQAVDLAVELFRIIKEKVTKKGTVTEDDVLCLLSQLVEDEIADTVGHFVPFEVMNGKRFRPRTAGQARYVKAILENEVVFGIGPAGTGKTYLAVAAAVAAMKAGKVKRLVLVRPAVEAGENLGFLPGDLKAKIDPYLRPIFDALRDMMDPLLLRRMTEDEVIEMSPLAYMRGRTLNDAFIILDEAQNTTISQMKMFLTRMGNNSRVIISGDVTQVDLPRNTPSGLIDALRRLRGIPNIAVVEMGKMDVVRHDLVQKIIQAYEEPEDDLEAIRG